ncbi:hypothetical protein SAMN05660199_01398 [Klenkia soli]|uniref:LysM domain-containing protein n=1 Tax=Klenkia soli TaxID=1052260 RepID=A0A1H0HAG8_9ACTN|nr:hypothetical protein [Klenkia soli]SDO16137.1 hypothetical protein SAMN05660199_01398 [Klenkia soli]
MTVRRWATTTAVMAAVGLGLWEAAPTAAVLGAAAADPQRMVDTQGPDALLLLLAWALAAGCWVWGTVGLLLTVAAAGGGVGAGIARTLLTVVLPAGLRRAAALAVGVSLVAAPALVVVPPGAVGAVVSTAAHGAPAVVPPTAAWSDVGTPAPSTAWSDVGTPAPVPDWPVAAPEEHVVLRGECLWDVAAAWLALRGPATDAQIADAVQAWWRANAAAIGPDPDLLLPGQVLQFPPAP